MSVTFRDKDSTTRLAGDLLIGGTTGDVATVQADGTVAPEAVPTPTPFNGGTITEPLRINRNAGTGAVPSLRIDAQSDGAASTLRIYDQDGVLQTLVGSDGGIESSAGISVRQIAAYTGSIHVSAVAGTGNDGDLFYAEDGTSNRVFKVRTKGPVIQANGVPADGDLQAGEIQLYFDSTNGVGNSKLMAKGKSADGTVGTAVVAVLT